MADIDAYLEGKALYGDDFDSKQIAEWYADEKEGYAELGANDAVSYRYVYHAWNVYHGYAHLPMGRFPTVLGFGAAYGDEFLPIISRIGNIIIVDPSESFIQRSVHGVSATYITPFPEGNLPLPDGLVDLTTCLGVLHHIPNVSFVLRELSRILKPGGHLVLREPIVSMGDWRRPRRGLTKRERGIPLHILKSMIQSCDLNIVRQSLCGFPLTPRLFAGVKSGVYNSHIVTRFDAWMANACAWNLRYHARNVLERFRPTSVFFVLRKPGDSISMHDVDCPPAESVP